MGNGCWCGRLGLALDGAAQGFGLIGVALAGGFELHQAGAGFSRDGVLALDAELRGRLDGFGWCGYLLAGQVKGVLHASQLGLLFGYGLCRRCYGCYGLGLWLGRCLAALEYVDVAL